MFPPMWPSPTKPMVVVVSAMSGTPFDVGDVLVAELEVGAVDDRVDLVGAAEADDGAVDGGILQRPCNRDRADACLVTVCDAAQPLDEREVLREPRLLEARVAFAPVVVGERSQPLPSHRPGQHSGAHRRVDDDPDPFAL